MSKSFYILGNKSFPTKEAITDHVRRVRSETLVGSPINDEVVLELLRKHPNWRDKSRDMAMVSTSPIQSWPHTPPSKEIVIITKSDSVVDISWKKCLLALSKTGDCLVERPANYHVQEVRKAARYIVQPDIAKHRQRGKEVDHVYPRTFDWLFADWLSTYQLKTSDIQVAPPNNDAVERTFVDTRLAESWLEHHRKHASLRAVSKVEHKKLPKLRVDWDFYT